MRQNRKGLYVKEKNVNKIYYLCIFVVSILFYMVWFWLDGIIITPDAASYIDMISAREPGYSVYLWIFRTIFGNEIYMEAAVTGQCILAAIAACVLVRGLQKRFSFGYLTATCILLIQYGMTLLNRFVAQRRYSYYNSIETEAITYSLWIFYILSLLGILYDKKKSGMIMAFIWCVILMSTRKQLAISFCILFCVLLFVWWKEKKWQKTILLSLAVVILGLGTVRVLDCTYNYAFRGQFTPHTGDSSFFFGTEVYVANEKMLTYIDSEENKVLFQEILDRAAEEQYNSKYAGKGWRNVENHYSECYDRIKFDIVNVVIRENQIQRGIPESERDADSNQIINAMSKDILLPCLPGMFKIVCSNVVHGFVTTVLKVHEVLNYAALVLYGCYVALMLLIIRKNRKNKSSVGFMAVLVLGAICVNVTVTSLVIYPQMRYMLYNTALFYQTGLLMIREYWLTREKKA